MKKLLLLEFETVEEERYYFRERNWYENTLYKMYQEGKSISEISTETKLTKVDVYNAIIPKRFN